MKINPIMAVLGFIFGLGGALVAYSFTGLSAELATNGSITLIASILGLIGIYLFEKDYKIAIAQYIICGLGVLIGTSLYGVLGCLFYIIAAIVAFVEKDKSGNKSSNSFDDIRFYGNENQIRQRYNIFSNSSSKNTMLWAIPAVSLIIIILVGVLGGLSYQNDMQNKANGIQINDISSDLKVSYGYYTGGIQGTLTTERDIESAQVKGVWYSADGSQIDQTYDSNILSDLKSNQKYQIDIPYYKESSYKPAKVEIEVYESFNDEPLYTKTVNLN